MKSIFSALAMALAIAVFAPPSSATAIGASASCEPAGGPQSKKPAIKWIDPEAQGTAPDKAAASPSAGNPPEAKAPDTPAQQDAAQDNHRERRSLHRTRHYAGTSRRSRRVARGYRYGWGTSWSGYSAAMGPAANSSGGN